MPSLFEFKPGKSLAHLLDPRCKLFLLCIISAGLVSASLPACLALLILTLLLLKTMGIGLIHLIRQFRYFILFLLMIILVRGLAEPGQPLFTLVTWPVSIYGLTRGGLVALRFLTVMTLGLVFSITTRPSELKAAAQWFLKPIPFIPEKRAGVIVSLALRFLPMILSQAKESGLAIEARCGNLRKNPLKKISTLVLGLLGKTFRSADELALAMEARCYTETRTDPGFRPDGREPAALGAGFFILLILLFV